MKSSGLRQHYISMSKISKKRKILKKRKMVGLVGCCEIAPKELALFNRILNRHNNII